VQPVSHKLDPILSRPNRRLYSQQSERKGSSAGPIVGRIHPPTMKKRGFISRKSFCMAGMKQTEIEKAQLLIGVVSRALNAR
jgi:hypothetical protein